MRLIPKSFLPKVERFKNALKSYKLSKSFLDEYYMLPDSFWDPIMTESNGFYSRWDPVLSSGYESHCKYYSLVSFGLINPVQRDHVSISDQDLSHSGKSSETST
jgi:hypothetical protein